MGASSSEGGMGGFGGQSGVDAQGRSAGNLSASERGSRLGQSGSITSRSTSTMSRADTDRAAANAGLGGGSQGGLTSSRPTVTSRTTKNITNQVNQSGPLGNSLSNAPTLRLTADGLLLTPNVESSERLGDNLGGDRGQGQAPEPQRPIAPEEPPAPTPSPAAPRQRAAALQRTPAVPEERTLLTLSLADVTRKSLLGI